MSTGVTAPRGFRAAGVASGIKPGRLDLAMVVADRAVSAAGVFTTNRAQAAPVLVSREHLEGGRARAVVANAGCANAATGQQGLDDAREMAALAARALGCPSEEIVVASTGVIGVHLPMDRLRSGIPAATRGLSSDGGAQAALAIMTTDTRPKEAVVEFPMGRETVRVGVMAKGAGMIAPNMATMLAFFTTDANVAPAFLRQALVTAVGETLNRVTVDGDTSTNDTAVILANGASGTPAIAGPGSAFDGFCSALTEAAAQIAEMIVRDGEGATRVARVRIDGAASVADADRVARTVAESPLVKTALHGGDPNWGRLLAAAGRAGVAIDPSSVSIWIGDVQVAAKGGACDYAEDEAHREMLRDTVEIRLDLGQGDAASWMWTCDLSRGYVDINAHYRS
jgi:glutamate N-acetyltransferase/amino-acid N-acetyltransferase